MDRLDIGLTGVALVLILTLIRVPIGVTLGVISFVGIAAITNLRAAWGMLTAVPFNYIGDWSLSAIPMFLLMGFIASYGGLTSGVFNGMRLLFGRAPGGLACASVGASALFASASGSSVATAAAMSRIAVPEMLRARYDPALATGSIAAAGTLGSLIPPSILMILFGIFAQVSIGELFVAGFIPGILSAAVYMAMIMTRSYLNPALGPPVREKVSRAEGIRILKDIWAFPLLVVAVLGGIFLGIFSPTEAGAVGAFLALVISLARRGMKPANLRQALIEATISTASIFIIVLGAALFTRFMALSGVPAYFSDIMLSLAGDSTLLLILLIAVLFIVLGMFIDGIGLMLLTLPIILPLLNAADVNLIWFGIIVVKLLELGLITPPVGLNVYVIKSSLGDKVPLSQIFKGAMWFMGMDLVTIGLLIAFPAIVLFLPSLMN